MASILESSVLATAWLHMPGASATILMSGYLANTSFAAFVRSETTKWAEVVRKEGLQLDAG